MTIEPFAGSPSPLQPPIPWEDRQRLGRVLAFVETLRLFTLAPREGFARMRERGDLASPLIWGVLCAWLGVVAAQFWSLALGPLAWLTLLPGGLRQEWAGSVAALAFGLVATPLLALVGLFVSAAIVQLFLWMFGGLAESRAGYEGTLRVVAYSSMAQVANVVPIVGWVAAVGWTLTLQVLGLTQVHRTTPGRAIAAVLMPALLCCAAALVFLAAVVALVAGAILGTGAHRP